MFLRFCALFPKKCMSFYEILEVDKAATSDEIRIAYKKQLLKCHPDKVQTQKVKKQLDLNDVINAYKVLSDPIQRKLYDSLFWISVSIFSTEEDISIYVENILCNKYIHSLFLYIGGPALWA